MSVMFTRCMGLSSQIVLVSKWQAAERERERERIARASWGSTHSYYLRKDPVKVTGLVQGGWRTQFTCLLSQRSGESF